MKLKLITALMVLLLISAPARALIIYDFDFSDLTGVTGGSGADFSISLSFSDYVTSTGMNALSVAPIATTLGYSVSYAGTSTNGSWGFDNDANSGLTDYGFFFGGDSFLFIPTDSISGYYTAPGTYSGSVRGNAPSSFFGDAVLTVTDTSAVPEPGLMALFSIGLIGMYVARRKV